MPYDPQGNHALPAGSIVNTGDKVLPSQHNPPLRDISSALSAVLVRDGRAPMVGALPMGGFPIQNMQPGTNATDAATVGQGVPVGAVLQWALKNATSGWLLCYGQTLDSGTSYPLLRQALIDDGFTYGDDGSGNPKLPDCRGRVIAGADNMGGTDAGRLNTSSVGFNGWLGTAGGDQTHKLTEEEMPKHTHGGGSLTAASAGAHRHDVRIFNTYDGGTAGVTGNESAGSSYASDATSSEGAHTHTISGSTAQAGSDSAHPNVQPTICMNMIIRASY